MDRPQNAHYSESHEWFVVDGDELTMGITDFAVEHLSDIVFVDLPEVGTELGAGDTVCEIESVKAVAEVYSAVAGSVSAVNEALGDDPSGLSADPFGNGWLVKLKVADTTPLEALMDAAAYGTYLETAEP